MDDFQSQYHSIFSNLPPVLHTKYSGYIFFDYQVIVTSELPRISVMATVLLGEFLHLCHLLLPQELNLTGHCLPSLLQEVASTDPLKYE